MSEDSPLVIRERSGAAEAECSDSYWPLSAATALRSFFASLALLPIELDFISAGPAAGNLWMPSAARREANWLDWLGCRAISFLNDLGDVKVSAVSTVFKAFA